MNATCMDGDTALYLCAQLKGRRLMCERYPMFNYTCAYIIALFPGLPLYLFSSLRSVYYSQRTKMGEAWEQGYIYYTVYPMNNTVSSILNSHIYLSFLQTIYSAQPD